MPGTRVYVQLPNKWKNKIEGLCGNFDSSNANEYGDAGEDINEFASAFKTNSLCKDEGIYNYTQELTPCLV